MTVKELISTLKLLPPNAPVYTYTFGAESFLVPAKHVAHDDYPEKYTVYLSED